MSHPRLYRRFVRRETHASRSVSATIAVLVLALGATWVGIEIVLHLLGMSPLAVTPRTMANALAGQNEVSQTALFATAAAALVAGVVALALAVAPGRRGRHGRVGARTVVIIDDSTLASSAAASVAEAAHVPRSQVRVSVGKRSIDAEVTPVSGTAVSREAGERALRAEVEAAELETELRAQLRVRENGVVGA